MAQPSYSQLVELLAEKDRQIARLEARVAELEGLVARLEVQNRRLTQLLEQAQRTNKRERIIVLDHGETIAEGPPEEIRDNPKVIEAYLGEAPKPWRFDW